MPTLRPLITRRAPSIVTTIPLVMRSDTCRWPWADTAANAAVTITTIATIFFMESILLTAALLAPFAPFAPLAPLAPLPPFALGSARAPPHRQPSTCPRRLDGATRRYHPAARVPPRGEPHFGPPGAGAAADRSTTALTGSAA